MSGVPVRNLAVGLGPAEFDRLAGALASHSSIRHAVDWLARHEPPVGLADAVAMDEYCHDLLADYPGGLVLVYDTT
jgi:hypothetical protein